MFNKFNDLLPNHISPLKNPWKSRQLQKSQRQSDPTIERSSPHLSLSSRRILLDPYPSQESLLSQSHGVAGYFPQFEVTTSGSCWVPIWHQQKLVHRNRNNCHLPSELWSKIWKKTSENNVCSFFNHPYAALDRSNDSSICTQFLGQFFIAIKKPFSRAFRFSFFIAW